MGDIETASEGRYRPVTIDGRTLTLPSLGQISCGAMVLVDESARLRAVDGQAAAERIAHIRPLYGRNTGVGANRDQPADDDAPTDHGLAILRSHAAGWGDSLKPRNIRCALAIRANQLLAGGSGADINLALALADLAQGHDGDLPQVHRYGALAPATSPPSPRSGWPCWANGLGPTVRDVRAMPCVQWTRCP